MKFLFRYQEILGYIIRYRSIVGEKYGDFAVILMVSLINIRIFIL